MSCLQVVSDRLKATARSATKNKRFIMTAVIAMLMMAGLPLQVYAADEFLTEAAGMLGNIVSLIGAGLGVWGIVNLVEGYGNDNPGSKSQGMKQLMAGVGLVLLGLALEPLLSMLMP